MKKIKKKSFYLSMIIWIDTDWREVDSFSHQLDLRATTRSQKWDSFKDVRGSSFPTLIHWGKKIIDYCVCVLLSFKKYIYNIYMYKLKCYNDLYKILISDF